MEQYQVKFDTLCDIMADLGLYNAMLKCHELNQLPPEADSSDEESLGELVNEDDELRRQQEEDERRKKEVTRLGLERLKKERLEKERLAKQAEKKKNKKPAFNPYEFKLEFMGIKPPSSDFISFVDTGATKEEDVQKGIHQKGRLSNSSLNYQHNNNSKSSDFDLSDHAEEDDKKHASSSSDSDSSSSSSSSDDSSLKREKAKIKRTPVKINSYGYHGGGGQDSWRISKGKVRTKGKKDESPPKKKASSDSD